MNSSQDNRAEACLTSLLQPSLSLKAVTPLSRKGQELPAGQGDHRPGEGRLRAAGPQPRRPNIQGGVPRELRVQRRVHGPRAVRQGGGHLGGPAPRAPRPPRVNVCESLSSAS